MADVSGFRQFGQYQHIALTPSSDFGGNKKRLTEFSKRFGFVENKGKNRAFSTKECWR